MMNRGFIALHRTGDTEAIIMHHPNAFLLLTQIAMRARIEPCNITALDVVQSLIGDHDSCGLTRQQYRTALRFLTAGRFVTIKATSKGTVATLLNTSIYSTKKEKANQHSNHQPTINQPLRTM